MVGEGGVHYVALINIVVVLYLPLYLYVYACVYERYSVCIHPFSCLHAFVTSLCVLSLVRFILHLYLLASLRNNLLFCQIAAISDIREKLLNRVNIQH